MRDASQHRSLADLTAQLPEIAGAPKDAGRLDLIVVRPDHGLRETPDAVRVTAAGGLEGDHWAQGCHKSLPDGSPHPDVQICMMAAPVIRAIAGNRANWAAAGDNLFFEMDLSPANLPAGTRLALGEAELEVTEEPHAGCASFIERYGRDACIFVNTGPGKALRLRGRYARVTRDGVVRLGDRLRKI